MSSHIRVGDRVEVEGAYRAVVVEIPNDFPEWYVRFDNGGSMWRPPEVIRKLTLLELIAEAAQ